MSVATFALIAGSHLAQLADIGRPLPASPCCVAPCLLPSSPRRASGAHLRVRADTPRHAATRRNQVPATASRPRHTAQIVHSTPAHPAREAPPDTNPSEGSMAPSKLGRRIKFALSLLTALDGDRAGTDTSACSGYPALCDRPMFPALFITDITTNPTSTAGDWQHGGTPIPPDAVFGTWKGAVRTVNKTRSPALVTVLSD